MSPRLFIGNLPWTVGKRELKSYFSKFGRVTNCIVAFDKETGFSKGYGFVSFQSEEELKSAVKQTGHILEGNKLSVGSAQRNVSKLGS